MLLVLMRQTSAQIASDVPLSHQAWSIDEGLPSAAVRQVFQSADGYLWLATEDGAARFDGYSFRVFRHETDAAFLSNDISSIAQDASGTLWFGTSDGLIQYRNSGFRRFTEQDGLPSGSILSLAAAGNGGLLVLTSAGLARFDGSRFHAVQTNGVTVASLQPAPDGAVWLITGRGVETWRNGAISASSPDTGPAVEQILGLQLGPAGAVWTQTVRAIAVRKPGFERVLKLGSDLPGTRLNTLFVDREGTGWIGTNRGLFFLRAGSVSAVQPVDSLRQQSVLSIFEDREGNVWAGTEASGLHALRPRKFRSEPAAAGEAITAGAATPDGTVWFGTRDDGLHRLRQGVVDQPVPSAALTSPIILSVAAGARGDIWAGTPDGLNHILGNTVVRYTSSDGLPDDLVRSVLVDSHGVAWAGTRRGLARIEKNAITTFTRKDGLGSDSIGPLLETVTASATSYPDLWLGTADGLSHLAGKRIENFSPHPDAARNVVTAIAQDQGGTLWVGLQGGGLARFAHGRFSAIPAPLLPADINSLVADTQGFLWLRAARGIYHIALAALEACADNNARCDVQVAAYGTLDGLPGDAATADGFPNTWQDSRGELWFATSKGLASADPARLPINSTPPPVVIERFLVDDAEVQPRTTDVEIEPGHSRYTFDFAALSFTLPLKNRYRYMLEGLDRQWVDAGTSRVASYTSLPAGAYRFRVQAQNNDGVWSTAGAELRFHVLPPLYRRWWFYTLVIVAIAVLVAVIFGLRFRYIRRRFALVLDERTRIAREIHDTLAQDFVSVSLQLDLTTQTLKSGDTAAAASQLQSLRAQVKEGLNAARQSIWNLRASTSENSLPTRLTGLGQRYVREPHPPRITIGGAFRELPANLESDLLRIAQEALANAYRHSAATEVLVHLRYDPDRLQLTISDNGRGFSPGEATAREGHYGLRGMTERAASIGAELNLKSSNGEGTVVAVTLPLD